MCVADILRETAHVQGFM